MWLRKEEKAAVVKAATKAGKSVSAYLREAAAALAEAATERDVWKKQASTLGDVAMHLNELLAQEKKKRGKR